MLSSQVKTLWGEMVQALKSAERFYELDRNHAVHVEVVPFHADADQLKARMRLFERIEEKRGDTAEVEWDSIDMESLPANALMRVVDIKRVVERWNSNELAELPPSTMADFLADREHRRLRRRRYT